MQKQLSHHLMVARLSQGDAGKVVAVAVGGAAGGDVTAAVTIVVVVAVVAVTAVLAVAVAAGTVVVVAVALVGAVVASAVGHGLAFVVVGQTTVVVKAVAALRTPAVASADNHGVQDGHITAVHGILKQTLSDYSGACVERKDHHSEVQVHMSVVCEVGLAGDGCCPHQCKLHLWEEGMTSVQLLLRVFPFQKPEKQLFGHVNQYSDQVLPV